MGPKCAAFLVVFSCFALVSSSHISITLNQTYGKGDELVYKVVESLEKWVDTKLDGKYQDMKQENAQTFGQLRETVNEGTRQQHDALQQTVTENKEEIVRRLMKLEEMMNGILSISHHGTAEEEIDALKEVIRMRDDQLDAMKSEMHKFQQQISELGNLGEIRRSLIEQNQRIQHQTMAIREVSSRVWECVTDIKVSPSEQPLDYSDVGNRGYFVTGFDRIRTQDISGVYNIHLVRRRAISFLKNNTWTPLHE